MSRDLLDCIDHRWSFDALLAEKDDSAAEMVTRAMDRNGIYTTAADVPALYRYIGRLGRELVALREENRHDVLRQSEGGQSALEKRQLCYVLDDEGRPVPEPDPVAWSTWYQNARRHVAHDTRCGVTVSTVFLAVNHAYDDGPPILYETMVFGSPDGDDRQRRYATREEALAGHAEALAEVMAVMAGDKADP